MFLNHRKILSLFIENFSYDQMILLHGDGPLYIDFPCKNKSDLGCVFNNFFLTKNKEKALEEINNFFEDQKSTIFTNNKKESKDEENIEEDEENDFDVLIEKKTHVFPCDHNEYLEAFKIFFDLMKEKFLKSSYIFFYLPVLPTLKIAELLKIDPENHIIMRRISEFDSSHVCHTVCSLIDYENFLIFFYDEFCDCLMEGYHHDFLKSQRAYMEIELQRYGDEGISSVREYFAKNLTIIKIKLLKKVIKDQLKII